MCGIVAFVGSRDATRLIIDGLRKLEYRGYDSAGIATVIKASENNSVQITCTKAKGKLKNLSDCQAIKLNKGNLGIGHTRWATHGKPDEINAHPHMDELGEIAVVQNGIIENHNLLRNNLITEGFNFLSETDTEVVPHLIAKNLKILKKENQQIDSYALKQVIELVLKDLEGSYSLAILCSYLPDTLILVKKHAPLIIGFGEGEFLCASDTTALSGFTKTILPMEDNEIAFISSLGVEIFDSKGIKQNKSPSFISKSEQEANKANFRHYMLKEIHDQPRNIELWVEKCFQSLSNSEEIIQLPFSQDIFNSVENIQILACGTSRHASLIGSHLLEQFAGIPTSVFYASEFRYSPPPLIPNTLTIGVTQSGETADTLAALKMEFERRNLIGNEYKSKQLGITNRPESSLARQVDNILDIEAGLEVGVAATKTFIGQLLAFYSLAIGFALNKKSQPESIIQNLVEELINIPSQAKKLIKEYSELSEMLAHRFANVNDAIFLGRGINYPIALEGALKLKEVSYIHAEGYPAGEMKHGPIALLDKNVPVISIASPGIVFEKVISNAQEAKARDAQLIGIGPKGPEMEIFDYLYPLPEVSELVSPLLSVLPTQLLSYHIAAHRGLDVDQPRNLAKSVTVE